MKSLGYIITNIFETLLRVLPFPAKTGLIKVGNPNSNSPVLLTCNFHLTVERVKKQLKGMNCYLLLANSRGINVWCAATGGLLTNHDVISVLKTSGIEELVEHKKVILPQLAATGIETKVVLKKSGWRIIWGPVYAKDIPEFINNNFNSSPEMRKVNFPLIQRFEMAVAWAFPISLVVAFIFFFFWKEDIPLLTLLIWALSFLIFISFPVYSNLLNVKSKRVGFILFDFGRGGFQLILWAVFLIGLAAVTFFNGNFSWQVMIHWGFLSLVVILILSLDLAGSTPVYKSGLHEDRLLDVYLDLEKCKGAGFCEQVCPRNCYVVDKTLRKARRPRGELCVQCGACIVQCPFDALYFKSPDGDIIPPDSIRKFKLNLMGKRFVKTKSI